MQAEQFHLDADGIFRCSLLLKFDWLSHGFGTRVASPQADVTLRQVHSSIVLNAAGLADRQEEGDALITAEAGLAIGVRTADCVPLLIADGQRRTAAAVHAGWRGTVAGISQHTVVRLGEDFGCGMEDLHVAIGPCIRECCYQVGADVARQFAPFFPEWPAVNGNRALDLAEANRRQLIACGVPVNSISDCGICTSCNIERFFSYRREPENAGRMTAAIERMT